MAANTLYRRYKRRWVACIRDVSAGTRTTTVLRLRVVRPHPVDGAVQGSFVFVEKRNYYLIRLFGAQIAVQSI